KIADILHRRRIGTQSVRHDLLRPAMALQRLLQKPQSCRLVAGFRHIAFQNLAFMIDSTPQVVGLAIDLHVDLIRMPAPMAKATHPAYSLTADISREQWTK